MPPEKSNPLFPSNSPLKVEILSSTLKIFEKMHTKCIYKHQNI